MYLLSFPARIVAARHRITHRWQSTAGHSLPELLTVLAIIAILSTMALPLLSPVRPNEAEQVFDRFTRTLGTARALAITRQQPLVLCPSLGDNQCGTNWHAGLLIFVDTNHDGSLTADDVILDHIHWLYSAEGRTRQLTGSLRWRAFGNRQQLRISELGEVTDQNGSLSWCPPPGSATPAHQLVINAVGRLRLAQDNNGDGLREDSQGRPISC